MANILALETSTDICSVSVNNDREFLHFHEALPRQHSEKLLGIISDLINQVNLTFKDLDSIAVAVGPGSYTGLRLSCAIAQGLAYAQKIDVVSLSSLELLSLEAHEKTGFDEIISEELVEINPFDAKNLSIKEKDIIKVESRRGSVTAKAKITDKSPEGAIFMSFAFPDKTRTNDLTSDAVDFITETPEYKACAVRISIANK